MSKRPYGLQAVPKYKKNPRFGNPHKMTNVELDEAWERDYMKYKGEHDKEYFDNLSRMEYEIKKEETEMPKRSFRPNPIFEVWRADEVAECMKTPDELYAKLWNDIVPLQGELIANDGSWCLAKYWSKLTPQEQIALNIAAVKHSKEN